MGPLLRMLIPALSFGVAGALGLPWNWSAVFHLMELWGVRQFDVSILVPLDSGRWKEGFSPTHAHATATLRLSAVSEASLPERWNNFRDPFLLLFHVCHEEEDFRRALRHIASNYNFTRRSRRASGSIYNFLLLSPALRLLNTPTLCEALLSDASLDFTHFRINTNVFLFEGRDVLLEIYAIKARKFCDSLSIRTFQDIANHLARRRDFHKAPIIATAAVEKSTEFEVRLEEVEGSVVSATGLAVNIFKDMEQKLNFKGLYIRGDWVLKNRAGQPSGTSFHQLRNGSADLYITQTTLAVYRAVGLNYLQPTFQDGLFAFLQQPPSSSVHDVHISPFQTPLWLTLFALAFILAIAFSIFTQARAPSSTTNEAHLLHGHVWSKAESLREAFSWAMGLLSLHGYHTFPTSTSTRLLVFSGALFGMVVYITYSGSIISSLTSDRRPINSFLDLLKSSLHIYVDQSSTTIKSLVSSLQTHQPRSAGYHPADEGVSLAKVIQKPGALFAFSRNFYRNAANLNISAPRLCAAISKLPIFEFPLQNAMLVPRFSPYRETLNWNIMELKERGLVARYLNHFKWDSTTSCSDKTIAYQENLGVQDLVTPFAILIAAHGITLLLLLLELRHAQHATPSINHKHTAQRRHYVDSNTPLTLVP